MMFGLSRLLQLAGNVSWRLNGKEGQRCLSRPRRPRRHEALEMEELEGRLVPTLLAQPLFPVDNPWNQNISNAPVASRLGGIHRPHRCFDTPPPLLGRG
jgi:hypothetical protein